VKPESQDSGFSFGRALTVLLPLIDEHSCVAGGGWLARNPAIDEFQHPRSAGCDFGVVRRNDQRGVTFGPQVEQEFDNLFAGM